MKIENENENKNFLDSETNLSFKTIKENENLNYFYKLNFNGLHFKNNNPNLNLNDLETEFKTLLNDFVTRKKKTLALKNCLDDILKIKYSVSTKYIKSFFNSTITPKQKENKIRLLKKGFNVERKSQILLSQKSYFLWNFEKTTYKYNKFDLKKDGSNKYNKENVIIRSVEIIPTLKQQNKTFNIQNYRLFLNC